MGQRPKNECLIPKCSDFGYFIFLQPMEYFSFIIFKMLFFIFCPLPEKLLDCPKKKLFCPTLGELQPP